MNTMYGVHENPYSSVNDKTAYVNRGAHRAKKLLKVSQIKVKIMLNLMTFKKEAWVHATLRENKV